MKLALLVAFTPDRKSGFALSGLAPYDEQLAEFKRRVGARDFPAGHQLIELWTQKGTQKKHRFGTDEPGTPISASTVVDLEALKADSLRSQSSERQAEAERARVETDPASDTAKAERTKSKRPVQSDTLTDF